MKKPSHVFEVALELLKRLSDQMTFEDPALVRRVHTGKHEQDFAVNDSNWVLIWKTG